FCVTHFALLGFRRSFCQFGRTAPRIASSIFPARPSSHRDPTFLGFRNLLSRTFLPEANSSQVFLRQSSTSPCHVTSSRLQRPSPSLIFVPKNYSLFPVQSAIETQLQAYSQGSCDPSIRVQTKARIVSDCFHQNQYTLRKRRSRT